MSEATSSVEVSRWAALGDQAWLAYCRDEAAAVRLARAVDLAQPSWLHDVVPAYASVGVFFDRRQIDPEAVRTWLEALQLPDGHAVTQPVRHVIPVCYERQLDLDRVREATGLIADEIIQLHAGTIYQVYAIGFVPGFPYLGYLPPSLCGVGRLPSPRLKVDAGSVGLTQRQTGVYPLPRPGGWNIIGQTPLTIVDVEAEFFPIQVGDEVQFTRIDEQSFTQLTGERLPRASRPG